MKKRITKRTLNLVVQPERTHFLNMLAKNPNYFGNIPGSKLKPVLKLKSKTDYEELTCVGYNPDTEIMEATFSIKRSSGFSGNLCTPGSVEYVRFYLDFHDGAGFIDQGYTGINTHDIPADKDCQNHSIFPIKYVASLKKKTSKISFCGSPVLPTLKAILSWNQIPEANNPNWPPVWGNAINCDVQLKPIWLMKPLDIPEFQMIDISKYLTLATDSPNLTSTQISEITGVELEKLKPQIPPPNLADLVKKSKSLKVPPSRFAFKTIQKMLKYPASEITMMDSVVLAKAKINVADLIDKFTAFELLDTSKANVDYEELECIGLDYNMENLVATIKVKKKYGFSGDLCDSGSMEYISFWIDWNDSCSWEYLDTVQLKVHDISMSGDSLCYSVTLPLDTTFRKKLCANPNVVRIRSVLSWNHSPSSTDPDKLEYYGNRVDAHIQIKPGIVINPGQVIPLFNIIGGIDVAHVNDITGLTKPGSFFAYNSLSVPTSAPFGGVIVLNGPSFPGYKYRIKITNLTNGSSYYASNSFTVVGHQTTPPVSIYTTQAVGPGDYYTFLNPKFNTLNVLARFTPGSEDKFKIEIEVLGVPGVFWKTIQINNTPPYVKVEVDDNGDCTHYKKGQTITGKFHVYDKHIKNWSFGSRWGGAATGTSNTPIPSGIPFSIPTPANAYPCGGVHLTAWEKTIYNSQSVGRHTHTSYSICLTK